MQQQQQQSAHPVGPTASSLPPPAGVTTEQIQKYLDENKQLILAILDNQNSGKLAECAQYQAQLQKNLLYLAAIADAQPQAPAMRPQMIPHAGIPPGSSPYMQQPLIFPPKGPPLQFTAQQVQELQQQQMMPPSFQSHMGIRPVNFMNMNTGMHNNTSSIHTETSHGPTSNTPSNSVDGQGNKQDGAASEDNHNKISTTKHGSGDSEPPAQLRRLEEK